MIKQINNLIKRERHVWLSTKVVKMGVNKTNGHINKTIGHIDKKIQSEGFLIANPTITCDKEGDKDKETSTEDYITGK